MIYYTITVYTRLGEKLVYQRADHQVSGDYLIIMTYPNKFVIPLETIEYFSVEHNNG